MTYSVVFGATTPEGADVESTEREVLDQVTAFVAGLGDKVTYASFSGQYVGAVNLHENASREPAATDPAVMPEREAGAAPDGAPSSTPADGQPGTETPSDPAGDAAPPADG